MSRRQDLLSVLALTPVVVILAMVPNVGLATALFGDPQVALDLLIRPLPVWAAAGALVIFPVTVAASELPLYFGYVQPRLETTLGSKGAAIGVAAAALAVQHVTLPLVLDVEFILWRGLMFVPFALLVAVVMRARPRLLPYLLVVHFIADLGVGAQVWGAAA